jgi:hypothetical protein
LQQLGEAQAEQPQGTNPQYLAAIHGSGGEMSFAGSMHFHDRFPPVKLLPTKVSYQIARAEYR